MAGNNNTYLTEATLKKRKKFLEAYIEEGTITHAAARVGINRATPYDWIKNDPEFAAEFERAKEAVGDKLEKEAIRRACEGINKPIYYKGQKVDTIKEYSDTLLIFLLKGQKPEKFGDKITQEISGPGGGPIQFSGLPDDELEKRIAELSQKR